MPDKRREDSREDALIERAREEAKRLEADPEPVKDVVKVYREGMVEAEKLKKFLKPVWFVKDGDPAAKKREKPEKSAAKRQR